MGFCQRLAVRTSVNNGYTMLTANQDRPEVHKGTGGKRDYSKVLEAINFSQVSGKNIILVDDVVTKGRSFRIIANHLMALGANCVHGIILAKTHWPEEEGQPNLFHYGNLAPGPAPVEPVDPDWLL